MLSDVSIRAAKPGEKQIKLPDRGGLYLLMMPDGGKLWRLRYMFDGREKCISLGRYPEVSLKMARDRRDDARRLLATGVDPSAHRQAEKNARADRAANTFELIAREWHAAKVVPRRAPSHSKKIIDRLVKDAFPWIGGKPMTEIAPVDLIAIANRINERGAIETAHRVVGNCGEIFRYAIVTGRATSDPTRDLRGQMVPKPKARNRAALVRPSEVGELLRAIHEYRGQSAVVRAALKLAPLLFVRPGELRAAEWKDIDLSAGEWVFMMAKVSKDLVVPLSRQAVEILRELFEVTGSGRYVFPSARTSERTMSNMAVLAALRGMGFTGEEMSGHGFRAMARTILDEVLRFPVAIIELQLGHEVRDPLGTAYNRTSFIEERRTMMQQWANYLDALRTGELGNRPAVTASPTPPRATPKDELVELLGQLPESAQRRLIEVVREAIASSGKKP